MTHLILTAISLLSAMASALINSRGPRTK